MKLLNEHFRPLNEDMRFEALSQLREIQANLVAVSFLPVVAIMREENPLRKEVINFQSSLDELTMNIQDFVSNAATAVEYEASAEEIDAEADPEPELDDEGIAKDNQKQKDMKAKGKKDNAKSDAKSDAKSNNNGQDVTDVTDVTDKTKDVEDSSEPKE